MKKIVMFLFVLMLVGSISGFSLSPSDVRVTVVEGSCGDGFCQSDETCSICSVDCGVCPSGTPTGGGSSGGSSGGGARENFVIDKDRIKVQLKQGESKQDTIKVTNLGSRGINIKISNQYLNDFLAIDKGNFYLDSASYKTVNLIFGARIDSVPDLYLGRIIFEGSSEKRDVVVGIEVESLQALFDVRAEILKDYRKVSAGNEIVANIDILNLGDVVDVNIEIEYEIRDLGGNVVLFEEEEFLVGLEKNFDKKFVIPKDAESGTYVLYVKTNYQGTYASASDFFEVKPEFPYWVLILLLVLIIVILFVVYWKKRKRNYKKRSR